MLWGLVLFLGLKEDNKELIDNVGQKIIDTLYLE